MDINNLQYSNLPRTVYVLTTKVGTRKYFLNSGEPLDEVIQRGDSYFMIEEGDIDHHAREVEVRLEAIDREELHAMRNRLQ